MLDWIQRVFHLQLPQSAAVLVLSSTTLCRLRTFFTSKSNSSPTIMKLVALGLVLPLTLAASSPSQIYFSPNPHHSTHSQASGSISLTPPQANAVLAHHLGVAQYEHLPHSTKGDRKWEEALGSSVEDWTQRDTAKIVILMECGKEGCRGA